MKKRNTAPVSPSFRHGRILQHLKRNGEVRASALAAEFGVAVMTVWRDLAQLAEQGLLQRVHGGARAIAAKGFEPGFEVKAVKHRAEKLRIAKAAVEYFVRPGDFISMEGGTTVAALVGHLPETRISVATNSLPVALRIREERPAIPVRVLGGWLSGVSGNTVGPEALREASARPGAVCFLGASAWDPELGPMDPNPMEIEVKRALAASASRIVMLLDGSKFGERSASVVLHPRRIHAVVTDRTPAAVLHRRMREWGIRIVVAP